MSQKVKIGLVGLGGHGNTIKWAVGESDRFDVVSVFDINEELATTVATEFGCKRATSYEALLADESVEAVSIVTPNFLHYQQVMDAFAHNKHVFVDKPIANKVSHALEMLEASEKAGKIFAVGHNMRFGRASQLAHQMIEDGKLGTIVSVELHYSANNTQRMPKEAWRLDESLCPMMPVMQLAVHGIDLLHYHVGIINEVFSFGNKVTVDVIDAVSGTFKTDNGVLGTIVSHYCTQVDFSIKIAGTDGTLNCTPHKVWYRSTENTDSNCGGTAEVHDFVAYPMESYARQMDAFGKSIQENTQPEIDGWNGLRALAVVEAMHQSIQTEQVVKFPVYQPTIKV